MIRNFRIFYFIVEIYFKKDRIIESTRKWTYIIFYITQSWEQFLKYINKRYFIKIFILQIILNLALSAPVRSEIKISEDEDRALYQILNLHTKSAQQIIDSRRQLDQQNIYLEYLENWKEVIELIGYEDQDNYEVYINSFENRLEKIRNWEIEESESHYITLAEMYAHAGLANVMYGDNLAGFKKTP